MPRNGFQRLPQGTPGQTIAQTGVWRIGDSDNRRHLLHCGQLLTECPRQLRTERQVGCCRRRRSEPAAHIRFDPGNARRGNSQRNRQHLVQTRCVRILAACADHDQRRGITSVCNRCRRRHGCFAFGSTGSVETAHSQKVYIDTHGGQRLQPLCFSQHGCLWSARPDRCRTWRRPDPPPCRTRARCLQSWRRPQPPAPHRSVR